MNDRFPADQERAWLTIVEAARYLGIGEETVRRGIADGTIPHWRPGPRTIRIPRAALEAIARDLAKHRN